MNAIIEKLVTKFIDLSQREKWIIILAILTCLWAVWDALIYQPFKEQRQLDQTTLAETKHQIQQQKLKAIQLKQDVKTNPNIRKRQKLEQLKKKYQSLKEKIRLQNEKFIPPKLMAKALTDLLTQASETPLVNLKTLPVTTLLESKNHNNPIYKHSLVMTFTGDYVKTLNYLKDLESLRWSFVIERIDYQVKDYPLAEITLYVHTLSFEEGWLNV